VRPVQLALVFAIGCGAPARTSRPAAPMIGNAAHTCTDAAMGLERATRGVRAPETRVFDGMRARCTDSAWSVPAIDCFATMREGELDRCARVLPDPAREAMFGVLAGGDTHRTAIAMARARLETLAVGIAECDRFVSTVAVVLTCERMPIDTRAELGTETAEFWDLPTHGLPAEAQRRMAVACGESLAALQQQAIGAGCMP
jgi:hypothetical protein